MLALSLSDKFCCFGIFVFVFVFYFLVLVSFLVFITFFVLVLVFVNDNHAESGPLVKTLQALNIAGGLCFSPKRNNPQMNNRW